MTNSLVGDNQVVVVDLAGELKVEKVWIFKLVYCVVSLCQPPSNVQGKQLTVLLPTVPTV